MHSSISLYKQIKKCIYNEYLESERAVYKCIKINKYCTIFEQNGSTKRVMIPTDVILEWVSAYNLKKIQFTMSAREMRKIIAPHSLWAPYQHGFETHLKAVIMKWAKTHNLE